VRGEHSNLTLSTLSIIYRCSICCIGGEVRGDER
jgi:hypothetical protein